VICRGGWFAIALVRLADHLQGHAMSAGHVFPEESPGQTANALLTFFIEA
jgi:hypothetical protein